MRCALLFLLVSGLPCAAADLYPISGVVVDAKTGAPRPNSRVAVVPSDGTTVVARQTTGPDGKFHFDVPRGKYNLESDTYGDWQRYGVLADSGFGSSLIAAPDQDNTNLIFRWYPRGAITGIVVDDTGEPVEHATVELYQSVVRAGRRVTVYIGPYAQTDDRGQFRFGQLSGGIYYLRAGGKPWYAHAKPASYVTLWYADAPDRSRAVQLSLKPGEEATANFTLHTVFEATNSNRGDGSPDTDRREHRPPAVSGTVQLKHPGTQPKNPIFVRLTAEDGSQAVSATARPDGSFSFAHAQPGRFRIDIGGADGYFACEIHVDGASYTEGIADLIEGETVSVRITASDETGTVSGYATKNGHGVEGMLVVLAPASVTNNWGTPRGFQTDHDGSYEFRNVPSGDYRLFAVEDLGLEYANPAATRPYLPSAKSVHVEANSTHSERIAVSTSPK